MDGEQGATSKELIMDNKRMGILVLAAAALWWLGTRYDGLPGPPAGPLPPTVPPPTGETKPPVSEMPIVPLDVWQSLTKEQLQGLPVTEQTGKVGVETYYKTSTPIAIGDTGFNIWGMSESGATIISKNPPETYPAWEWMR